VRDHVRDDVRGESLETPLNKGFLPKNVRDERVLSDNILFERSTVCAFVVLMHKINHKWSTYQRYAHPEPDTPVFVQPHQRSELQQKDNSRRVTPGKEEVFASQIVFSYYL